MTQQPRTPNPYLDTKEARDEQMRAVRPPVSAQAQAMAQQPRTPTECPECGEWDRWRVSSHKRGCTIAWDFGDERPTQQPRTPGTEAGRRAVDGEAAWPQSQARTRAYVLAVEADLLAQIETAVLAFDRIDRDCGWPQMHGKEFADALAVLRDSFAAIRSAAPVEPTT